MDHYDKRALDLALKAGSILLECGAEISRVEETIVRIANHFGISRINPFILSSGVFLTAENSRMQIYAQIKLIPLGSVELNKVDAVNQLSREIEEGKYTLEEAEAQIKVIAQMPKKRNSILVLASGTGAGSFCYVIGGRPMECLASFLAGVGCICFCWPLAAAKKRPQNFW